jgi:hypothetical protein
MERKMETIREVEADIATEETIGSEDRLFADFNGKWYWQARGTSDCAGPFESRGEAMADYEGELFRPNDL